MISVGIDVSKSKSTVAILNSDGSQRIKPYNMKHNQPEMNALVNYLNELDETIILACFQSHRKTEIFSSILLSKLQNHFCHLKCVNSFLHNPEHDI